MPSPEEEFYAIAQDSEIVQEHYQAIDKELLVGIPIAFKEITYYAGRGEWAPGIRNDMVSIRAITAPQKVLDQMGINVPFGVNPGSKVIINDSSTGIYRQVTKILHDKGLIEVDTSIGQNTLRGSHGSSCFDQPRSEWINEGNASEGIEVKWMMERGLRQSKPYETDYGIMTTFYI
jgi:hypothetical protein